MLTSHPVPATLSKARNLRFPTQLPSPTLTFSSWHSAPSPLTPPPLVSGIPSSQTPYLSALGDLCITVELLFFSMLRGRSSQGLSGCMQVDPECGMYPELYTPGPPDPRLDVPDTLVPGKGGLSPPGCVPDPGCRLRPEPKTAVPPEGWLEPGLPITVLSECMGGPEP